MDSIRVSANAGYQRLNPGLPVRRRSGAHEFLLEFLNQPILQILGVSFRHLASDNTDAESRQVLQLWLDVCAAVSIRAFKCASLCGLPDATIALSIFANLNVGCLGCIVKPFVPRQFVIHSTSEPFIAELASDPE